MSQLILNVDDNAAGRYAKSRTLRLFGYDPIEASTGQKALQLVEQRRPTLVLLDVKLPDINGIEVCRLIKERFPETLVLQISASYVTGVDKARGLDNGADAYLTQPVEAEELVAVIRALFRARQAEDALRTANVSLEQRVADRTRELAEANASLRAEIAERERAQAALVQAQKMEAVGHLTGGIAHDFNNLLTAVLGNLELIQKRTTDPRIERLAQYGVEAAERGVKLTGQLLVFSRRQRLSSARVEINTLVRGVTDLVQQSIGSGMELRFALHERAGAVVADSNQLELALLNLAINARDAMGGTGEITIGTDLVTDPGALGLPPGDYLAVTVSDAGEGMPPEVLARAFDPFFTTKPPGKGTGLGLSQVYGVAQQAGGTARIESSPGNGTTVTLVLPRVESDAAPAEDGLEEAIKPKQQILVVDDDPSVLGLLRELLEELGYGTRAVSRGAEALEAIEARRPDALILDFAMPEMNGAEVAQLVRERWPDLPIIFATGYADSAALEAALGNAPLLRKPFRLRDLATALGSVGL